MEAQCTEGKKQTCFILLNSRISKFNKNSNKTCKVYLSMCSAFNPTYKERN